MKDEIRMEHAFLAVRSLDRSLEFYRQLFPHWVVRWSGESGGGRWIHFGAAGDGQPSYLSIWESPAIRPSDSSAGIRHIGFTHPNVAGLTERLGQAGIAPHDGPMDDGDFVRAYYMDPDGHQIELVQSLS